MPSLYPRCEMAAGQHVSRKIAIVDLLTDRSTPIEALMAALIAVTETPDLPIEQLRSLLGLAADMASDVSTAASSMLIS